MSFIGSYVRVTLKAGGQVEGPITAIDPNTGLLTVVQGPHSIALARSDIADLSIIPAPQTQQASSSAQKNVGNAPSAPAAMSRGGSGTGTPKTKAKATNGGRKSKQGKAATGFGSAVNGDNDSDLDEDFDFDKALKSFDKQKIWHEIKTADRSDPANLLVSHNRRGGTPSNAPEDKLAWNEPVLSPTIPTHTETPPPPVKSNTDGLQSELERVRGTALQRDVEVNKLREQVVQSHAQCALLEALLGVRVEISSSSLSTWTVRLHADSTRSKGLLTVSMTSPANSKLRYLGPIVEETDANVLQRLPDTYKNEMGLKVEHASLFFRRLKDAIQQ